MKILCLQRDDPAVCASPRRRTAWQAEMGTQQGGLLTARVVGGFEAGVPNAGTALNLRLPCASVSSFVKLGPVPPQGLLWEEPGT